MNRTLACLLAAGTCAASATAGLSISHEWVQIDNTVGNPGGDAFSGAAWNAGNWATFDLFLTVQGALVNGINLGSAPGEDHLGLIVADNVFNTTGPAASNFETSLQGIPTFAASLYDTYVTLGTNNPGGTASTQLLGVGLNGLVPNSEGVLRGAWAHNPEEGGTPQDASAGIRILRLTIDLSAETRGVIGTGTMQIGLSTGVVTYTIPVPAAPGAAALGIGALFAARRRR